jgi:hypothetical protein
MFTSWAQRGFVVMAMAQPRRDASDLSLAPITSAADMTTAIDWAVSQSLDPKSIFHGAIDLGRVVTAGADCGAGQAIRVAATDSRVRAVLALSADLGAMVGMEVLSRVAVPVGFISGSDPFGAAAERDYRMLAADVPAVLARRSAVDHLAFVTQTALLDEVAVVSSNWLTLTLGGELNARRTFEQGKVCDSCGLQGWTVEARKLERLAVP